MQYDAENHQNPFAHSRYWRIWVPFSVNWPSAFGVFSVTVNEVTQLLHRMSAESGDSRKRLYDELVTIVYGDLKRRAVQQIGGEQCGSLQPTLLVHEAYERLLNYRMSFENRDHFLNAAAAAMRRILIDRARKMRAVKRGSGKLSATLSEIDVVGVLNESPDLLIDLDRAVEQLSPEQVQLTELRFFAGFTFEETAEVMHLKVETAKKRWEVIRTILFDKLEAAGPKAPNAFSASARGRGGKNE